MFHLLYDLVALGKEPGVLFGLCLEDVAWISEQSLPADVLHALKVSSERRPAK